LRPGKLVRGLAERRRNSVMPEALKIFQSERAAFVIVIGYLVS